MGADQAASAAMAVLGIINSLFISLYNTNHYIFLYKFMLSIGFVMDILYHVLLCFVNT